ncbi:LysR substrate-binding domain-containing protein [Aurantivibrio infirmus]
MHFHANLRHLAALSAISRLGSINKAADSVHISQSALTQGLSKIEKELGVSLFDRSATGMYPTSAGNVLLSRLDRAFQYFNSIEKELLADKRPRQAIHLSFSNSQLRAVIAAVDERNISLAARKLSLAQPTVQRAVREVESICERQLFVRSATGVEPTQLARQLAQSSSLAFAEIQSGADEVHETKGLFRGELRIGSLPLARTDLVPATVTEVLQRFPSLKVSIIDGPYEELLHGLTHGKIDLILGALRKDVPSRNLLQETLFEDSLSVIVRKNHPLLTKNNRAFSFKTLSTMDWIAPRTQTPARLRFQEIFASHKIDEPGHIIECSSSVAIRGLLLRSDRLALLSKRQVQLDIESGILAVLPMEFKRSARAIGVTTRKDWRPTAGQQHYLDIVRKACATSNQ